MAIQINDDLLNQLGLQSLPAEEKQKLLKQIYDTLEMRVGMKLAEQMTDAQLDEFEQFVNTNDEQGAFHWLETNFPNYKDVVAAEFESLKKEIGDVAPQILAAANQQGASPAQPQQPQQVASPPQPGYGQQYAHPSPPQPPYQQPSQPNPIYQQQPYQQPAHPQQPYQPQYDQQPSSQPQPGQYQPTPQPPAYPQQPLPQQGQQFAQPPQPPSWPPQQQ